MNQLAGKIAIITGAAQGMGAAHARRFAAEGACVVMTDIKEQEGKALCAKLGPKTRFVRHDVAKAADWAAVVAEAESAFGPVNVLVNNAGIGPSVSIDDMTEAEYRRFVDVNQVSVFLGIKAVLPSMMRAGVGSIVNISSAAGILAFPNGLAYIASKFAVRGMTKAAAIDLADRNIRVNSVHPGMIRTPMAPESDDPSFVRAIPMHRSGEPEDVTAVVAFLASDESRYCTGAEFVVDGGMTAQFLLDRR